MSSYDFTTDEFEAFLDDFENDSSLLVYPQIRKKESDTLFYQDDKRISVGFFDLDYDYNAKNIHEMFMDTHNEEELVSFAGDLQIWNTK